SDLSALHLRQSEYGVVGGDDEVARQGDLESAAEDEPRDRGDDGLGRRPADYAHPATGVRDRTLPGLGECLEVHAGAKRSTGAGQGIGEAYVTALAEAGAAVVVADINETGGSAVGERLAKAGHKAVFVRTDVTDETATQAMAARAVEEFGGIDILVNNAAIY